MKIFISLLILLIVAWYVNENWQYWTQNERQWKMDCTFPETKGHIQTIADYKLCLTKRHITPNNADIRKMCYYYARDKYYTQTGKYPNDANVKENILYKSCLHEQGLSE